MQDLSYRAIATDFDGTLATEGIVDASTIASLIRYREAGGKLILITGRILQQLLEIFSEIEIFDGIVAENGAVFYNPHQKTTQFLGKPFPEEFISTLAERNVQPVNPGQVLVATRQPHQETVQEIIDSMGIDASIILNKQEIMILPTGVNKATGLKLALAELGLDSDTVVGIGDAENDEHLLLSCGLAVAVANAVPELKAIAHRVTTASAGSGVQEIINWILSNEY